MQDAVNAIASVGFPIVACVGIFYLYDNTIKNIANVMDNVTQVLDNVLNTMNELSELLHEISNKLEGMK